MQTLIHSSTRFAGSKLEANALPDGLSRAVVRWKENERLAGGLNGSAVDVMSENADSATFTGWASGSRCGLKGHRFEAAVQEFKLQRACMGRRFQSILIG